MIPHNGQTLWLDTYTGPVWRYASPNRPITQLPLALLAQVIDPDNLGHDVRTLITAQPLTDAEIAAWELVPA